MFEDYPDVVKVEDIQSMLNIGKTVAYKLIRENTIKSIRVGKKYIIPKQSVINFVNPPEYDIMTEHNRLVISKEDSQQ